MPKSNKRFEVVHEERTRIGETTRILRDKETGVCYLQSMVGVNLAMTPLLNSDGSIVVQPASGS
ncbi:DUF6440 family protein [Calidifontibacter indicus]|jgi:hypothetical protein|uniref:DUF6440 domain-containing protein n=1 Tax=Calidifontibacter indicus TaxID=419650 RepID=A0A3D9UU19_9MICO|nr:DUF6440 family protein [Calidifontibacter indicus]REF30125.1 hypothetical protein DFJ65_1118 [Calidifontibacter indicus]